MSKYLKNCIYVVVLCIQSYANASDTIVPDRPGFSTGTYTVQPGRLNMEIGYDYAYDSTTNIETLPLLVLRTGISEDIELDLIWDGLCIEKSGSSSKSYYNKTVSFGLKYNLVESDRYNISFMGLVGVQIGSLNGRNNEYFIGLFWDRSYSDYLSFFGAFQTSSYRDNDLRGYDVDIAIGSSFVHTEKLSTFLEVYTKMPQRVKNEKENYIGGGIMYLISGDVQIDINIGFGLNKSSYDYVGAGLAIRF